MTLLPALLLCAAAWAASLHGSPEASVTGVFAVIAQLQARQVNVDARDIRRLDSQCEALAPEVLKWGWRAAAPLSRKLSERSLPVKTRLLAVSFLGLLRDPSAFPALKTLAQDATQPPLLRASAAESLPSQGVSKAALGAALCPVLSQDAVPRDVLTFTLIGLAQAGCADPAPVEKTLRALGPRPAGLDLQNAQRAMTVLSRSLPPSAAETLLSVLPYYPPGSPLREAALEGLWKKREDLRALPQAGETVLLALREGSSSPSTAVAAISLLAYLGHENAVPVMLKLLDHGDLEVVTASAEALARLRVPERLAPLQAILGAAHTDERFAPRPGRPEPQALAARLKAAAAP